MQKPSKIEENHITKEALKFLKNNFTASVATSHKNIPYVSVMYYVADDNFNFYFLTRRSTDKYLNLRENKNIAIVVGTGPKQISLKARGHAEILTGQAKRKIRDLLFFTLKDKGVKSWPIKKMPYFKESGEGETNHDIVFCFKPQHISFMNLDDKKYPKSISENFHFINQKP